MMCARSVENGNYPTLQTIDRKGLVQVLIERGVPTRGMTRPQLEEILGAHADFAAEKSAVQHILVKAGHIGFFGDVCHSELVRRYEVGSCQTIPAEESGRHEGDLVSCSEGGI